MTDKRVLKGYDVLLFYYGLPVVVFSVLAIYGRLSVFSVVGGLFGGSLLTIFWLWVLDK